MKFKGSAMYLPHQQGMFRDLMVIGAAQCHPLPQGIEGTHGYDCAASDQTFETLESTIKPLSATAVVCPRLLNYVTVNTLYCR